MSIVEGCSVSKVAINLSQLAQTFYTLFAAVDRQYQKGPPPPASYYTHHKCPFLCKFFW